MNEIRREDRDAKLIRDVSAIVEQEGWPDYIEGFSVRLGLSDWEPAGWITYRINRQEAEPREGWDERAKTLNALTRRVSSAILAQEFGHPFYFRFDDGLVLNRL